MPMVLQFQLVSSCTCHQGRAVTLYDETQNRQDWTSKVVSIGQETFMWMMRGDCY